MILFVDDDTIYIQDYLDELEELPDKYFVHHERNIDKAFEFIIKNSQDIELLVLDMMIPSGNLLKGKDNDNGRRTGKLFIEELKKKKDLKLFPIIFFTHVNVQNFQSEVGDISLGKLQKEDFTPYLFSLEIQRILNPKKP
jgi:CheY-like chemotaxis protein